VALRSAVYLLRRAVNLSMAEVSALAGVSISRVSQIQRNIEAGHTDDRLRALMEIYKVKN
jgi:transcriptional regulator with XRE-family HTH domain